MRTHSAGGRGYGTIQRGRSGCGNRDGDWGTAESLRQFYEVQWRVFGLRRQGMAAGTVVR